MTVQTITPIPSGTAVESIQRTQSYRGALAGLSLSMLLASLGISSANVALPALVVAFGVSFQHVQWVVLAYLLASTTLIVSVGKLGDFTGRRRLLLAGIVLFTCTSALCGLAPSLSWLIAARAAQGLGAALMMVLALALVAETVPRNRVGSAMGLLGTMSAIGTALGPALGGVIIAAFEWRAIFLLNVPLAVVAWVCVNGCIRRDDPRPRSTPTEFDLRGTLVLGLTLGAYALAMTTGRGHFAMINASLLLAALAGAIAFVRIEATAAAPLISLGMFRDSALTVSLGLSTLVSTVLMATLVVGPFYLARALGLEAARVGLVLSIGPVVAALMGVPAGRMTDRLGVHRVTKAGLVGIAVGCVVLGALPAQSGLLGYVAPIVVVTAGYALFQTANNTAVMSGLAADRRALVSGLLNLSRNLGLITGASVMGAVFTWGARTSELASASPAAVSTGMRTTMAASAGLILAALVLVVRRKPALPDSERD